MSPVVVFARGLGVPISEGGIHPARSSVTLLLQVFHHLVVTLSDV